MSRRLPRVRKVLSYNKGNGGDLEVAMDALGPKADSPDELRRIFILGVTAHLAGYSTHRDGKGDHHLIRFMEQHPMEQHPAARQLAEEILGVGGAYPPTMEIGVGHRPPILKHTSTVASTTPHRQSARRNAGSNELGDGTAVRDGTQAAQVKVTSTEVTTSSNKPDEKEELSPRVGDDKESASNDSSAKAPDVQPSASKIDAEGTLESAQLIAVSPGETPEGRKNLPKDHVVHKKDVGNQPEIGSTKTVSNLTIEGASLTVTKEGGSVNAMTTAESEVDATDPVDEGARIAATELLNRAMAEF